MKNNLFLWVTQVMAFLPSLVVTGDGNYAITGIPKQTVRYKKRSDIENDFQFRVDTSNSIC